MEDIPTLELEIISPTKSNKISIQWIEIESPNGSFLVGINHSPLISIIKKKGILVYKKKDGKEIATEVYGGIFKVAHNKATIILDQ